MNTISIIEKKKDNLELSSEEIDYMVKGYTEGSIPDYQMSAFFMAITINGMTDRETVDLTKSMLNSGDICDLSKLSGVKVDKHSTGGVSDTTTMIIAPIIASSGLKIFKASGRGLGFTGGTIDKIEMFDGYNVDIPFEKGIALTNKNNACIMAQSAELSPADKKMYALRDVTGTVQSLPLIASSIMSKKLACNNDIILIDIKYGEGALMPNVEVAKRFADIVIQIGNGFNKKIITVISNMQQPLGYNIGDRLEVMEAVDCLKEYKSENRLAKLSYLICSKLIENGLNISFEEAEAKVKEIVESQAAFNRFKDIIKDGGGNFDALYLEKYEHIDFFANQDGYITEIQAKELAEIVRSMGGGRLKVGDEVDHHVGIQTYFKVGDKINTNDKLFTVWFNENKKPNFEDIQKCFIIGEKCEPLELVNCIMESEVK
ncbi:MAG: thymidine phosphorylase [Clostridia bacterium]|nr:thymidine phosphorylase [Clostridia bacterium]